MSMKISVIIPAYNVENYLPICVESVLHQTYRNIETILVDDGSSDTSGEICDRYANSDSRVIVIHKENGGLSEARNTGIEHATGDYVLFLDGDDFWQDCQAIEKVTDRLKLTNPDVLLFSFQKFYEADSRAVPYFKNKADMPMAFSTKQEQLAFLTKYHLFISSAWTKTIRRELLREDLLFEKNVVSEDVEWSAKLLMKAETLDFVNLDFYRYRQRETSISHSIDSKKCQDACKHIISCMKLVDKAPEDEKKALSYYTAYQYATFCVTQGRADRDQKDCLEILAPYCGILAYHGGSIKLLTLRCASLILGYQRMCWLIRCIIQKQNHKGAAGCKIKLNT